MRQLVWTRNCAQSRVGGAEGERSSVVDPRNQVDMERLEVRLVGDRVVQSFEGRGWLNRRDRAWNNQRIKSEDHAHE